MTRIDLFLTVGCLAFLFACSGPVPTPHPPVVVHIGGADSMQLLAQDLADAYHQSHPYASIDVRVEDSSSGLSEFARGSLDIALVSRNPTSEELKQPSARAIEIGSDAIVIIVNASNRLGNITREQLGKVFSGESLRWSELTGLPTKGGDDFVQVVSREDGSGTRNVFEQAIMPGRRVTLTALIQPTSRDVLNYIHANPNAIGYVAFNIWRVNPETKALSIDGVAPSLAAVQSRSFPLMQTYYLVLPLDAKPEVAEFLSYVLSDSARAIISSRVATAR